MDTEEQYYMMWLNMVGSFCVYEGMNLHEFNLIISFIHIGYDKVAELIFDNGGSKMVNYNETGDTPLCYVAYNGAYNEGHNKIAELLIQNGADVNLPCDGEKTPLHLAAIKSKVLSMTI